MTEPIVCRACAHPATDHGSFGCRHYSEDTVDTDHFTAPVTLPGRMCVCAVRGPG